VAHTREILRDGFLGRSQLEKSGSQPTRVRAVPGADDSERAGFFFAEVESPQRARDADQEHRLFGVFQDVNDAAWLVFERSSLRPGSERI
jgi:hypothetical protein